MSEKPPEKNSAETVGGFELEKKKKWPWAVGVVAVLAVGGALAAVNLGGDGDGFESTLVVAYEEAVPGEGALLEYVNEEIAPDYDIEIETSGFGDAIAINRAVEDHEVAATINQHQWWMRDVNNSQGLDLVAAAEIYQWAFGVFSAEHDSLEEIEEGMTFNIPDDPANQSQALWLLEREGLLEFEDGVEPRTAQIGDIAENPFGIEFVQLQLHSQGRVYEEYDFTVTYPMFFVAYDDLDALIHSPEPPRTFAAQLVIAEDTQDDPNIQRLIEAFEDPRLQEWLEDNDDGTVQNILQPVNTSEPTDDE